MTKDQTERHKDLLEISPYDSDGGALIGKDPRILTAYLYEKHFPDANTGMKVIRDKCIDCCGGVVTEVRKCVATDCPLWPLRMGSKPKGMREARGEKVNTNRGKHFIKRDTNECGNGTTGFCG